MKKGKWEDSVILGGAEARAHDLVGMSGSGNWRLRSTNLGLLRNKWWAINIRRGTDINRPPNGRRIASAGLRE